MMASSLYAGSTAEMLVAAGRCAIGRLYARLGLAHPMSGHVLDLPSLLAALDAARRPHPRRVALVQATRVVFSGSASASASPSPSSPRIPRRIFVAYAHPD